MSAADLDWQDQHGASRPSGKAHPVFAPILDTFAPKAAAKVDVLAVMEGDIAGMEEVLPRVRGQQRIALLDGIEQMKEARTAVAVLIEAAKAAGCSYCDPDSADRLTAALARIGAP